MNAVCDAVDALLSICAYALNGVVQSLLSLQCMWALKGRLPIDYDKRERSDTGNRTPGYRVRGDNVSHYTISDASNDQ